MQSIPVPCGSWAQTSSGPVRLKTGLEVPDKAALPRRGCFILSWFGAWLHVRQPDVPKSGTTRHTVITEYLGGRPGRQSKYKDGVFPAAQDGLSLVSSQICLRQPQTCLGWTARRAPSHEADGVWERKLVAADFWVGNHWAAVNRLSLLQGTTSNTNRRPPRAASGPAQHRRLGRSAAWLQLPSSPEMGIWRQSAASRTPKRAPNATKCNPRGLNNRNPCIPCSSSVTVGVGGRAAAGHFFFPAALQRACFVLPAAYATSPQARRLHPLFSTASLPCFLYFCILYRYLYRYTFCS